MAFIKLCVQDLTLGTPTGHPGEVGLIVPKHAVATDIEQDPEHAIPLYMVAIGIATLGEKPNGELAALSRALVI